MTTPQRQAIQRVLERNHLPAIRCVTLALEIDRELAPARTNLDDAIEIVAEIDRVRSVIRELKAAFAKSELDGGAKAAPSHPLYIQAQEKLDELHDQLMMVI